jgi:sortase (surface protein transpeptidase)
MVACLTLLAVACGGGSSATGDPRGDGAGASAGEGDADAAAEPDPGVSESGRPAGGGDDTTGGGDDTTGVGEGSGTGGTAATVPVERGRALPVSPADQGPVPVSISIDSIDVAGAPVRDVGVEADGQMEIPGAREVGWYRFGSTPGGRGSSVLAAHIAFNGVDGIFRHLDRAEEGDLVTVGFDDGSEAVFVVRATEEYFKEELPDDIWDRDGDSRLVLITCGGGFNEQLRSYDSNVVLYAEPVD